MRMLIELGEFREAKLWADKALERFPHEPELLAAKAVYGFFPANAIGDDLELYVGQSRKEVLTTFHFLRQQMDKGRGEPNYCLADFVAPKGNTQYAVRDTLPDYLGAFAVTAGFGTEDLCKKFERDHADSQSGLGLGLAICRAIVELHGGEIHVEKAGDSDGATFAFTLPLGEPPP